MRKPVITRHPALIRHGGLAVDIDAVLDRLMEVGVTVWLDDEGKLRVDKDAPEELKDLVRQHKQELTDVRKAQAVMNRPGMRFIRLPLGHLAVAYPLGADLNEIRWAMKVLRMDSAPLVVNEEGLHWISCDEWLRQRLLRLFQALERGPKREGRDVRFRTADRLAGPPTRDTNAAKLREPCQPAYIVKIFPVVRFEK